MKPGRNDPCHCGSGKKYKKCHLRQDEEAHLVAAASVARNNDVPDLDMPGALAEPSADSLAGWEPPAGVEEPAALSQLVSAFRTAGRSGLLQRDPELRRLFKGQEILIDYLSSEQEIEDASKKLEPYRAEFNKLCEDDKAASRQTEALFAEPAFVPFRFTAAEVEQVLAEVGLTDLDDNPKKSARLLRKAVMRLSTDKRRTEFSMRLLLLLPEYVQQGRYLDALFIQSSALATAEETKEPNPFLAAMFFYGLQAWSDQQQASQAALLKEAGFDVSQEMDPQALERWVKTGAEDPQSAERLRRLLEAHPELHGTLERNLQRAFRRAVDLLDREDSARLLLAPEELDPWKADVLETIECMFGAVGTAPATGKLSRAQRKKAFDEFYLPLMRRLSKAIFTPERIARLGVELRAYHDELSAADDPDAASAAMSAILSIEAETQPEMNLFLVNLCARSARQCILLDPESREPL